MHTVVPVFALGTTIADGNLTTRQNSELLDVWNLLALKALKVFMIQRRKCPLDSTEI